MLRTPTVFVIGAGAGYDIGMPLGGALSTTIGDKLDIRFDAGTRVHGDELIYSAIKLLAKRTDANPNEYRRVGCQVAKGIIHSRSIDGYLHSHKDNKLLQVCGKLAIVRTILEHEARCALYVDDTKRPFNFRNPQSVHSSWFGAFMHMLVDRIVVSENLDAMFSNLAIINFNYDRCVEHFLFHALIDWSNRGEGGIAELLNKRLTIFHPYGLVGRLPWQSGDGVGFGAEIDENTLAKCSSGIRTFNEELEDREQLEKIQSIITNFDRIVFLGFHFHNQNVALLQARQNAGARNKQAFATAIHRSAPDIEKIKNDIKGIAAVGTLHVGEHWDCSKLFNQFGTTFMS
jgi:hypothetical protein